MSFGFVSRNTYEIAMQNCKKINEKRAELEINNKALQRKIKKLEQELAEYKKDTTEKTPAKPRTTRKTTKKEAK